jgi:hypothetical protein
MSFGSHALSSMQRSEYLTYSLSICYIISTSAAVAVSSVLVTISIETPIYPPCPMQCAPTPDAFSGRSSSKQQPHIQRRCQRHSLLFVMGTPAEPPTIHARIGVVPMQVRQQSTADNPPSTPHGTGMAQAHHGPAGEAAVPWILIILPLRKDDRNAASIITKMAALRSIDGKYTSSGYAALGLDRVKTNRYKFWILPLVTLVLVWLQ